MDPKVDQNKKKTVLDEHVLLNIGPILEGIPIIALSANAFAEDYKRSIEAGIE